MKRCWKFAPIDRPTFTALQKYFNDYKYVPLNSICFKLKGNREQSDCTIDTEAVYLCRPPPEVAVLFNQSGNAWDKSILSQDRWSDDDIYNTMRTIDTELPSEFEQSSTEEEIIQDVQMRNGYKPRDRRQKRSLVFPATAPDAAFTKTTSTSQHYQQKHHEPLADETDEPSRERYIPFSNSASKMFKSNPLNMYLEPAYKELLIPSESETSLDTDSIINTNNLPHNHKQKQGGFRYAYP